METSISASATQGCAPAIIIFDAALSESAVKYDWDFGDGTKGPDKKSAVHRYEVAGVYKIRVIVTYEKGCVDTAYTTVNVFPGPDARFKIQFPSNEGVFYAKEDSAVFINTSSPDAIKYFWDFGDGYTSTDRDGYHMYEHTGKYPVKLVVWNVNGCKDSLILEVVVRMHATIFTPNVFTPDDNRINELFYVETYNITEFEIIILNRWGEVIFESRDKNFKWDGRFRGQLVQQDVYVYYIKARSLDGEFLKRYGTISVLR
jgi:gliding motility-associated-like protein